MITNTNIEWEKILYQKVKYCIQFEKCEIDVFLPKYIYKKEVLNSIGKFPKLTVLTLPKLGP